MIKLYLRILVVRWKIYGFSAVFFSWLLGEPILRAFNRLMWVLDRWLFPGFMQVEVKKPIFIMGHPRSGTTFLHQVLAKNEEAVLFPTWHLLFPALSARYLLRPLINWLIKTGKTEVLPASTGHAIDLNAPEEEEMLFFNTYDTQFVAAGLLGFDDAEYPELQWNDQQPDHRRFRSMEFLHGCFQRQIYATGRHQIIAQMHFSTHRLKTMMQYYPDAKFIYMLRNPYAVVPSFLSLLHASIDHQWGLSNIPTAQLMRYNQRRYRAMVALYRYFYDLQQNKEIPENRVLVLPYSLLRNHLTVAIDKIVAFTGMPVSEHWHQTLIREAENQKHYQRQHQVKALEDFGITPAQIAEDFKFVFDAYPTEAL